MSRTIAAIFEEPQQPFRIEEFPTPEPAEGEILVRNLGCTLCGSDSHSYHGRRDVPRPTILGHEIVGEIIAFGDSAARVDANQQTLAVGDRVTWAVVASCGDCFFCRRGLTQKCELGRKYGHRAFQTNRDLNGGMATHCLLSPGTSLVSLPNHLTLDVVCPASCATATIAAALDESRALRGANVAVMGLGLLGMTACAILRESGCQSIVGIEPNQQRRELAARFGATATFAPGEDWSAATEEIDRHGFDVVLELSGNLNAMSRGFDALRLGGELILVGAVFPTPGWDLSAERIVRRNITIRGIHNYQARDLVRAVEFLAENHQTFPFAELVSPWLPLESADHAFELAADPAKLRVGIRMT